MVILNYNGMAWLDRCLASLQAQTLGDRFELIFVDNASADGSGTVAAERLKSWSRTLCLLNDRNLGFCEGNNVGARRAQGRFLLFLNNDTWLEPDALETLVREADAHGADGANPLILNYDDDSFQTLGAGGFDLFGLPGGMRPDAGVRPIFAAAGCALMVRRTLFERVGGFDAEFFLYADETDLAWRLWIAGGTLLSLPGARIHHRGAAVVNPKGGGTLQESRTSESKRFFANRNGLLFLLKNAQHLLLLLVVSYTGLMLLEMLVSLVLVRRWSFVRRAYLGAYADAWRLRSHLLAERRRIAGFRQRGDLFMLRFLRLLPSRFYDLKNVVALGLPKVDPK